MKQISIYTTEEVREASSQYFGGNSLAAKIWIDKYAQREGDGKYLEKSPEDMFRRLTKEILRIEKKYINPLSEEEIYQLFNHFRYLLPSENVLLSVGNNSCDLGISSGFVIGLDDNADSYGAIMKIDEEQIQLMKHTCGVGHDMSQLRPSGCRVNNMALYSTGMVTFMERYSNSAKEVAIESKHAPLLLSVDVKHPDSEAFIDAKLKDGKVNNVKLCLKLDNQFMQDVTTGESYSQQFPLESDNPQELKKVSAKKILEKIAHYAWTSSEPGVLFSDTIKDENVSDCYAEDGFKSISSNYCGEMPLSAYEGSLNLYLNLYSYVNKAFSKEAVFDSEKFSNDVMKAQRIIDDIVDLELEKIDVILSKIKSDNQCDDVKSTECHLWEKIRHKLAVGRRTGLGVTGEADMFAAMNLQYGSKEAIDFSVSVHKLILLNAYRSSVKLAEERGAFEIYDANKESQNPLIDRLKEADKSLYDYMVKCGRRNISCITIAPTGSISLLAETSSGIEPVVTPVKTCRSVLEKDEPASLADYIDEYGECYKDDIICHKPFLDWMKYAGYDNTKKYNADELDDIIKQSPYYKATITDVSASDKIKMQGAIQKWVDNSVASTIILPRDISETAIGNLYVEAWKEGCKSMLVYREGSNCGMTMISDKRNIPSSNSVDVNDSFTTSFPVVMEVRPTELDCDVVRFQNNKEKWVAFVGLLNGYPYEIFTGLQDDEEGIVLPKTVVKGKIIKQTNADGSHRYDFQFENKRGYKTTVEGLSEKFNPEYWNYAKLISGVLRYRMPIDHVIKLVASLQLKDQSINTWKNGVERALKKYVVDGDNTQGLLCPVCGHDSLVFQEGCLICANCGASGC
nr:adenosylcobalamin-dependent ribonucleoside-diphosphate reductase [Prevotella sp.]